MDETRKYHPEWGNVDTKEHTWYVITDKWILVQKLIMPRMQCTEHVELRSKEDQGVDASVLHWVRNRIIMGSGGRGQPPQERRWGGNRWGGAVGGPGGAVLEVQRVSKPNKIMWMSDWGYPLEGGRETWGSLEPTGMTLAEMRREGEHRTCSDHLQYIGMPHVKG
jgi:hypothetical protein